MASIRFKTRGDKNKPNATVYIAFSNGRKGKKIEISSGITAPYAGCIVDGKTSNELIRSNQFVNRLEVQSKLDSLRAEISTELTRTSDYTKEWLQGIVNRFHGIIEQVEDTEPTLSEMIDRYIDYITFSATETREPGTTKTYKLTKMRVEKFDAYKGHTHKVSETGVLFKGDFIRWARSVEQYSPATYLKSAKQIKTVIRYAKRIGLNVDESLLTDTESTELPRRNRNNKTRPRPLYLTPVEIESLMNFKGADYLENARDWLVVSCWTGCRVSDLMELTKDNIQRTIKGEKAILYTQKKTGDNITAPFLPDVEKITARHGGGFPRPISHQKYNTYIKELCKRVGMTEKIKGVKKEKVNINGKMKTRGVHGVFPKYELIVSHIGRRSFASNHYGELPTEIIMLVTGHDTVRQFLEYVGKDPDDHVTIMNEFYRNKENKAVAVNK